MGLPQINFFAYNMGAPSGQFLCLLYGGPLRVSFFAYYMGSPSDQFLRLLCGGPLRSVSSHTIWGHPQISFFTYYMPPPPPQVSFIAYLWGPLDFFFHFLRVKLSLRGARIFLNFQGRGQVPPLAPPLRAPLYIYNTIRD